MAGDGEVLWRTYTGTKLETADTAKAIPNVTRHSLTLPKRVSPSSLMRDPKPSILKQRDPRNALSGHRKVKGFNYVPLGPSIVGDSEKISKIVNNVPLGVKKR